MLVISSKKMMACSCIGQRSVQEEIKHVSIIFTGIVISKEIIYVTDSAVLALYPNDSNMYKSPMAKFAVARYQFLVQEFYKGNIASDTVIIYTGIGGGDCGVRFKTGEQYIVYGESVSYLAGRGSGIHFPTGINTYWTNSCLRTTIYEPEEITEINKYLRPQTIKNKSAEREKEIIYEPETYPVFKNGGEEGLKKFIRENLHYPKNGECVSGRVYVEFTVDTLGKTKNISVKRGITPSSNEEAIKVVRLLEFIPGKRNGQPTEMKMIIPINFSIEKNKEK
jgi:TonB family protein